MQAANEAATKGFDDQTRRLKENMGTLETWADRTARAFKSMWDAVLDIGRPDTAQEMLIKAEAAFKKADDIWNLRKDDYFVNDEARALRTIVKRPVLRLKPPERRLSSRVNRTKMRSSRVIPKRHGCNIPKRRRRLTNACRRHWRDTARQEELNNALKDGKSCRRITTR